LNFPQKPRTTKRNKQQEIHISQTYEFSLKQLKGPQKKKGLKNPQKVRV